MKTKSSKTASAVKSPKGMPAPSKGAVSRDGGKSPKAPKAKIQKLGGC